MQEEQDEQRGSGQDWAASTGQGGPSPFDWNAPFAATYGEQIQAPSSISAQFWAPSHADTEASFGRLNDVRPGLGPFSFSLTDVVPSIPHASSSSPSPSSLLHSTFPPTTAPTNNPFSAAPGTLPSPLTIPASDNAVSGAGAPSPVSTPSLVNSNADGNASNGTSSLSHVRSGNASRNSSLPPIRTAATEPSFPAFSSASASASTNAPSSHHGIGGTAEGNNARQEAPSGDAHLAAIPVQQAAVGQQSSVVKPNDSPMGVTSIKPVMKMKRTGQNFPLGSRATHSLHQRNTSSSPNRKLSASFPGSTSRHSSFDALQSKPAGSPLTGRQPNAQTPTSGVERAGSETSSPGPSKKPSGTPTAESHPARRLPAAGGPSGLLPKAVHASRREPSGRMTTVSASNADSDDEIMYEAGAGPEDLLGEGPEANESSSDDSDSDSDSESPEMLPADEQSFQQLFRGPDQESDDYEEEYSDDEEEEEEEEEGEGDDHASSASSSGDSSIADEPSVALPSANIQQQEARPSTILTMANSQRAYSTWLENGVVTKSDSVIFPEGYKKCTEIMGFPWICAVRSCRLTYKTARGLGRHFRVSHKKARLNDNMDGTLSLTGSYTKKNDHGVYPPVVVSRRALDPNEPPMVPPMLPVKSQKAVYTVKATRARRSLHRDAVEATSVESPPLAAESGSSKDMWEYIRPHLTVHSSLPAKSYSRDIIHLPRVREIKWNEERNKDHPFKDTHPRDVAALIVQVTGVEAPEPCKACAQGRGPFVGCILISPEAPEQARFGVLSCANCYYHCYQSHCSLCTGASNRGERQARTRVALESYNVKRLSDATRQKSAADRDAPQPTSTLPGLQASSRPDLKLYSPSEIKPIEMADKTRTYKVIKGKDGENILMHGALIPENYDLDRTFPGSPWICPVRSCRTVFKRIAALGGHFVVKHRGLLFNDNRDGTFSTVGYYNKPLPGDKATPALVISQNPLNPREATMAQPKLPGAAVYNKETRPTTVPKRSATFSSQPNSTTNLPLTSSRKKLWSYVLNFLPLSPKWVATDVQIMQLLELPRRRNIHWRKTWNECRLRDDRWQVLGLLIHLVGEEFDRGCTTCRRDQGPFPGCYVLPKEASYDSHQSVRSCANCIFLHQKQACSIKASWESRLGDNTRTSEPSAPPAAERATNAHKKRRLSSSDHEVEEDLASRRRSERIVDREDEGRPEPRRKIVTLSLHPKESRASPGSRGAMPWRTTTSGEPQSMAASSALINAGQVQSDDLLEMEDWEIAPGRIRETGSERIENIAFSKSYLETNQAVQVSADVQFEVKTIKSGGSMQVDADAGKTRYCSLASGKLRVRVEEQPEFTIGPHGMFKIRRGLKALVQNRLYVDSVLHIASHKEY